MKNPVGHNVLSNYMKHILAAAGIDSSTKSNHSLRTTAISRMFQLNVAGRLIMERSGHLTKDKLALYERTTAQQQKAVCKVLADINCSITENSKPPTKCPQSHDQDETPQDVPPPVDAFERKPDGEIMKKLQFHQMQGCTVNINVQL